MPRQSEIENNLPVITSPQQQITFYADDPTSFKQILTILNPYDFLVKFRISCTDCSKYTVSAAQGSIKSKHSTDIVFHHKAIASSNFGVTDIVRIQLYTSGQIRIGGKKDIAITLLRSAPKERVHGLAGDAEHFKQLEVDNANLGNLRQQPFLHERHRNGHILSTIIIVCCAIILAIPQHGVESDLPASVPRPTAEFKIWAALLLGAFLTSLWYNRT